MNGTPLVLVLGTADWNAPVATNQHHVTRALAADWPVVFAEGTGTRSLRPSDARRVVRRLRSAPALEGRPVPQGVEVVTPRVVPHHAPSTRRVNSALLHRQLRRWVEHPGPRLLWTYTPFTYGLERRADRTVYHLVDLLHENPGVHRGRLLAAERRLEADVAIGTSPAIEDHLRSQGFADSRCLLNVCDVALFSAAAQDPDVSRGTSVVFAGTLAPHKLDGELLLELAGPWAVGSGSSVRSSSRRTRCGATSPRRAPSSSARSPRPHSRANWRRPRWGWCRTGAPP